MKNNNAVSVFKHKLFSLLLAGPLLVAVSCSEKETITPTPDAVTSASTANARLVRTSLIQLPGPGERGRVLVRYVVRDTSSVSIVVINEATGDRMVESGLLNRATGNYQFAFRTRRFAAGRYVVRISDSNTTGFSQLFTIN